MAPRNSNYSTKTGAGAEKRQADDFQENKKIGSRCTADFAQQDQNYFSRKKKKNPARAKILVCPGIQSPFVLLRETIENRTYGKHENIYTHLFLLTIFGLIYYGPPSNMM